MIKPLRRDAHIVQSSVIQQHLLQNKSRHSFGQLASELHDLQTERNDLRLQQKRDHLSIINFDERADDAQRGEAEVLEGPGSSVVVVVGGDEMK